MQCFLQFSLGSHSLLVVLGHLTGDQHITRPNKVYTFCDGVAVADELLDASISFNVQFVSPQQSGF